MEDSINSNSNSLANAIRGLRKFDGREAGHFRDWHKKFSVVLGVTRRDIAGLINARIRPSQDTATTGTPHSLPGTLERGIASFDLSLIHI